MKTELKTHNGRVRADGQKRLDTLSAAAREPRAVRKSEGLSNHNNHACEKGNWIWINSVN